MTALTVEEFAALVQQEQRDRVRRDYPTSDQWQHEVAVVKPGRVYTKVDVGPEHNMSGRYMIENATGRIYGIKGYGVVHKGHYYGTLETATNWNWGRYYARKREVTAGR